MSIFDEVTKQVMAYKPKNRKLRKIDKISKDTETGRYKPANFSFDAINNFVHQGFIDVEDFQDLILDWAEQQFGEKKFVQAVEKPDFSAVKFDSEYHFWYLDGHTPAGMVAFALHPEPYYEDYQNTLLGLATYFDKYNEN